MQLANIDKLIKDEYAFFLKEKNAWSLTAGPQDLELVAHALRVLLHARTTPDFLPDYLALVDCQNADGGWSPFCADIAAHMAASGMTVVGIDAKDYLVHVASSQKPITAEELTLDYDAIAKLALAKAGVDCRANLILGGWSLGAGYSVLVASQPEFSNRVDRVVAISPPIYNELAWKPADALIYITHGTPREKVFDARQYVKKLAGIPVFILNATNDDTSPLKDAQLIFEAAPDSKRLFTVKAQGHHFEGGEAEFYRDLDQGLRDDENVGQSGSLAKK